MQSNTVLWTLVVHEMDLLFENESYPRSGASSGSSVDALQAISFSCVSRTMLIRTSQYTSQRLVALPLATPCRMLPCLNYVATMVTPQGLSNYLHPHLLTDHRLQIKQGHLRYDSVVRNESELTVCRRHLT